MIYTKSSYGHLIKQGKADNNFLAGLLFLFFIWPFGAFLIALYYYTKKEAQLIFVLFTGLYGLFMFADSHEIDLYRILQLPAEYATLSFGDIFNPTRGSSSNNPEALTDVYRSLVTFLVSRFTTNGNILTFVFGIIYGIVFVKSVSIFFDQYRSKGLYSGLILLSFSFIFALDQLAGVRYATAAYVFFVGALKFILTEDKKYLWLVFSAPLVHFGFLGLLVVFGLFFFVKRFSFVAYIILAASIILPEFMAPIISEISMIVGGGIEQSVSLYLLEQEMGLHDAPQRLYWHIGLREEAMVYFLVIVLAFSRFAFRKLKHTKHSEHVFFFTLLVLSLANFTRFIPHMGYRLQFVFAMFATFYFFLLFINNRQNQNIRILCLLATPAFFFQIIFGLRNILATSSPMLYVGNIFTFFIIEFDQSAWDFFL